METYMNQSKKKKELGASLVEYGLLVALIAVMSIAAVKGLGQNINKQAKKVSLELDSGAGNGCDPQVQNCNESPF